MADLTRPGTHRQPTRGQFRGDLNASVPESSLAEGRFGRMFRNLPSYAPPTAWLGELAESMATDADSGDSALPAGLTYFGQFIDHDLTFDPVSSLARQNDPDALTNFRTPRFDLDCVYGRGPDDQPYLYTGGVRGELLVGQGEMSADGQPTLNDPGTGLRREDDLPRNAVGRALIGDPRNDENILVSQLQLAFVKLHNQVLVDIGADGDGKVDLRRHVWNPEQAFEEAQRLVRWHYQWLVLKFFLPSICDPAVLARYVTETPMGDGRTCRVIEPGGHYKPRSTPYIPVEWSVAAYRFGHTLIRPGYHLNAVLRGFRGGSPIEIFIADPTKNNQLQHLAGERPLPPFWTLDWRMFFRFPDADEAELQRARRVDTHLAGGLQHVPGSPDVPRALAERNLLRGRAMGLPSGQAVARRLCILPLTAQQLGHRRETPLWFYVLREAEVLGEGQRLGPVGSTIVAETMLGLLAADPFSFIRTDPTWEPVLPLLGTGRDPADWDMADLLAYAVPVDGRHLHTPPQPPPPPPGASGW